MKNSLIEDILEYFLLINSDRWFIPPQVTYFMLVLTIIIGFSLSNKKEEEVKHLDMSIEIDSTYDAVPIILESEIDSIGKLIVSKETYWLGKTVGLPSGIVYAMDYAGSDTKDGNQNDNYVTVKTKSGELKITRDIDVDLYLNLKKGDTIK